MISVQKGSNQVAQSVVHKVIDAIDELMLNETDDHQYGISDHFHRSAVDQSRKDSTDVQNSAAQTFEKFDASFRIDEIAQFQESFHFNAVGLDSSYCTSNASSIESNNLSFAQESLLSFSRSALRKPALLDTSQSHNDDEDDISFASASSLFFESKRVDENRGDSKVDLKRDAHDSKPSTQKHSNKQVQRPAMSRTSTRRNTRKGTSSGDEDGFEVVYTATRSSRNLHDDSVGQRSTQRVHAQKMEFSLDNLTSSDHRKKHNDSMGQSSSKQIQIQSVEFSLDNLTSSSHRKTNDGALNQSSAHQIQAPNTEFSLDNLVSSSHNSQSSLRRKPYESPRRRVTSTTRRPDKETGNTSITELNSSSHHSQTLRRNTFRSPRRRAMSRDLSKTDSMHSSATDMSNSSSVKHYTQPLEKDTSNDMHATGHSNNNSYSSNDSLDEVDGVSDRRRAKMILICSDGLVSSSSHHSQSSRRIGLSSPRHRGRGSSRSNLGTCEKNESSERTEGLTSTASPTKNVRRARSRSRPRLRALGGEVTTSAIADSKSHRRCHSQPRLSREVGTDATRVHHTQPHKDERIEPNNETQKMHTSDHDLLDARTAARIERARASREKHLAKLQKEKEKARNEKRNHELFEGIANQSTSSYRHQ